jgi:MATE family multidrug resistance protein
MLERWRGPGGYRHILTTAFPLILSTASWAVMHFVDRIFLTWYSTDAVAAAMPAGIVNFTLTSLFIGTAGYVNTFVSQYYGAKMHRRVGPSLWQGIYFALIGGVLSICLIPLAGPLFKAVGHAPQISALETTYFRWLCLAGFPVMANSALAGFFSGLDRTWPIMWVNFAAMGVNIVLDYLLIFGNFGFPAWGIKGAAIASVLAASSASLIYVVLIFREKHERAYAVRSGFGFERDLFRRLIRYGLPNGVQFFMDVAAFSLFVLMVGRLGNTALAASNIAFNINTIAFMPMIGIGITCTVLTGQHLGAKRPDLAARSVWSAFHITLLYMTGIAALYVLTPWLFLMPYAAKADPATFDEVKVLVVVLLRFVALYSVFDSMTLVFAGALKGAGDTRYVMVMIIALSQIVMVVPSYLALFVFDRGIFTAWGFLTLYASLLGFALLGRFLKGKWRSMRVIEEHAPGLPGRVAEAPAGEV